ncbi:curli assembly protein CsgC [Salmonella enterica subsp. enterica serovar Weltevreden]|nr:curli assembly protein CsgC [Salmonella enterica subsp. enterica serovar Weltevreden]
MLFREEICILYCLAALSNQITFTTTQQGDITRSSGHIKRNPASVRCKFVRDGVKCATHCAKQTLSLPANQPIELSRLSVNISSEDLG